MRPSEMSTEKNMFNHRLLLEHKIKVVAKRGKLVEIGLLSILISCGGFINRKDGIYRNLTGFSNIHGESTVEEAKTRLIEEGILVEDENGLKINYRPLNDDDWNNILGSLARTLFINALEVFQMPLVEITSLPEGMYALLELCKNSDPKGIVSKDTISYISGVIGGAYWDDIRNKLERAGLFGINFLFNKHEYFLFPPLIDCVTQPLKESNLSRQLCYIYVAQHIRSEGMLENDCAYSCPDYKMLLVAGYVKRLREYQLSLVRTTKVGSQIAKERIEKIIQERGSELESLILRQPLMRLIAKETFTKIYKPLLDYIVDRSIDVEFSLIDESNWFQISSEWESRLLTRCDTKDIHICLLRDRHIREKRNKVLDKLVEMGLAARTYYYVFTRGGETRGSYYIVAPEVIEFINRYFGEELKKPLLSDYLEKKHAMFHVLELPTESSNLISLEYLNQACSHWDIEVKDVMKELEELKDRILYFDGTNYIIRDMYNYFEEIRKKYFEPIVEYLVEYS